MQPSRASRSASAIGSPTPRCSSRRSPTFPHCRHAQPRRQLSAARVSRRSRARPRRLRHAVSRLRQGRRRGAVAPAGRSRAQGGVRRRGAGDRPRAPRSGSALPKSNAGGRGRTAILADVCEALIGAVFLDGGYPAAAGADRAALGRAHAHAGASAARLQDRAAGMGAGARLADAGLSRGRAHRSASRSGIPRHRRASGLGPAEGLGRSKRAAEQAAAAAMLTREGVKADRLDG